MEAENGYNLDLYKKYPISARLAFRPSARAKVSCIQILEVIHVAYIIPLCARVRRALRLF